MKDKLLKIVTLNGKIENRRLTKSFFKKNHYEFYLEIIEKYSKLNIDFNIMLYLILNNISELPTCLICGKPVRFKKISQGFSKYCSMQCIGADKTIQLKREKTSIKNIGVKYTLQSDEMRKKIKQTNLERYGSEFAQKSDVVKEKTIKTNIKKYGVEHHLKLESQLKKQKETNFKRYGVENVNQNIEIINRGKQTKLDRYGDKNYVNINKRNTTIKEKYGVDHIFQLQGIKNKIVETNQNKYGFKSYSMTDDFILKVKNTKRNKFDDENYNNRDAAKITSINKYGVDNPSKSIQVINKIHESVNNNFKEKYSKLLSIEPDDVIINGVFVDINNYCDIHKTFEISKSLLYSRLIYHNHENICVKCNPIAENSSILESELKNYIKSLNLNLNENNTSLLHNNQEIDVYLPDYKLGIEFNGLYWHSELFKDKNYHLNKTIECEKQGIQLLHVFEDEWLYKKEIVKSIINNKLGIINEKIYARKCLIREITSNESEDFLNKNHIQGNVNSKIKLGLYYGDELVSVMTFEIARKNLGNVDYDIDYYNLNRFCNKINTNIIGGASKLLSYFIKTYHPKSIISYANRRYSQGSLYEKLGFTKINVNQPTYFYINKNKKNRYHRFTYRKEVMIKLGWYDESKTHDEMYYQHDLFKIYDCGSIKYRLDFNINE